MEEQDDTAKTETQPSESLELFESSLDTALTQDQNKILRRWNWDCLNRPIVLWLLSSVVIGLLAFKYSSYASCNAKFERNEEALFRIGVEVSERVAALTPSPGKRPRPYLHEFREFSPADLQVEAWSLSKGWDPDVGYDILMDALVDLQVVVEGTSSPDFAENLRDLKEIYRKIRLPGPGRMIRSTCVRGIFSPFLDWLNKRIAPPPKAAL